MSVKTLNEAHSLEISPSAPRPVTYSIAPAVESEPIVAKLATPARMDAFLEQENPLGCIRGVMWVMAFNAAVFALGFTIWQSCKFLW